MTETCSKEASHSLPALGEAQRAVAASVKTATPLETAESRAMGASVGAVQESSAGALPSSSFACASAAAVGLTVLAQDLASPALDASVFAALKTPRERNFLLKLESHIISNLKNDKIERIKLTTPIPPYLRFLVHLVADYFGLQRIVDQKPGMKQKATMTLLKTSSSRIPLRTLAVICEELSTLTDVEEGLPSSPPSSPPAASRQPPEGLPDSPPISPPPVSRQPPAPDGIPSALLLMGNHSSQAPPMATRADVAMPVFNSVPPMPPMATRADVAMPVFNSVPPAPPTATRADVVAMPVLNGDHHTFAEAHPPEGPEAEPFMMMQPLLQDVLCADIPMSPGFGSEGEAVSSRLETTPQRPLRILKKDGPAPLEAEAVRTPSASAAAVLFEEPMHSVVEASLGLEVGAVEAAEDSEDAELVSRPAPVVIPGKVKIIQRRELGEDSLLHGRPDGDDPSRRDISRLPLEEREQVYQQARARIFGEAVEAALQCEEAPKAEEPHASQRKAALQKRLAQEKMNDLRDPAYNRALFYARHPLGPFAGKALTFQAAPTDLRAVLSDQRSLPMDPRTILPDQRSIPTDPRTLLPDQRSIPTDQRNIPMDPRAMNMNEARAASAGQQAVLAAAVAAQAMYSTYQQQAWLSLHGGRYM